MTVQDQTIATGAYAGNDVADTFDYTWQINSSSQLTVSQTDNTVTPSVTTVLELNTDYTVSGIGDEGGGSITLTAGALPTNNTLQMKSNFVPTQLVEFASQGSFLPENHEFAYDKLTRLIQQLIYEGEFSLSFNSNEVFNTFNPALPSPVASGYLRVNDAGTAMEWVQTSFDPTTPVDFTDISVGGSPVVTETSIYNISDNPVVNSTTTVTITPTLMQSRGLVLTNALPVTVTIENNATQAFPVGAVVPIYQQGEGQVTIEGGAGVTLEYKVTEGNKISERYGFCSAWQRATDIWVLSGSLTA